MILSTLYPGDVPAGLLPDFQIQLFEQIRLSNVLGKRNRTLQRCGVGTVDSKDEVVRSWLAVKGGRNVPQGVN